MENSSSVSSGDLDDSLVFLCDYVDFTTINAVSYILIFIFSVTTNCLLIFVLVFYENLKDVTNIFVMNLACSDLVFTLTLPFWAVDHLHHWIFGDFFCKFVTAAYFVGLYSSIIVLTALTVDRFILLKSWQCKPRPVIRKRCALGACAAAWIISIGASLSDAINVEEVATDDRFTCETSSEGLQFELSYYLQVSLLFFLPLAIIVFCYAAILKTVLQASNRKTHRTVVVVLCIVAAFFICWGPYNMFLFVDTFYRPKGCHAENIAEIAFNICKILAFSHCCMNPLLYMLSQKMRSHLFHLLHCVKVRSTNRSRVTASSAVTVRNSTQQCSTVMLEL